MSTVYRTKKLFGSRDVNVGVELWSVGGDSRLSVVDVPDNRAHYTVSVGDKYIIVHRDGLRSFISMLESVLQETHP